MFQRLQLASKHAQIYAQNYKKNFILIFV